MSMSYMKVSGIVAAMVTALALSGSAYGDGKSPNGPPGPAGNPNQPASAPQGNNGPQGPAGNDNGSEPAKKAEPQHQSHVKKAKTHGKSGSSHGKSNSSHGNSGSKNGKSHANPSPGTPRKGGREDRPAGKITICHATKSVKNPYVEITISVNGLHGHGPAEDPHHHAGSWKDIIPAPAGGCPSAVQPSGTTPQQESTTTTPPATAPVTVAAPEVAATEPATPGQQAVLGAQAHGTSAPAGSSEEPGQTKVLGASASGTTPAPAAATATRPAGDEGGSLPFTGFELVVVLLAAAAALLGGFALRRATARGRS